MKYQYVVDLMDFLKNKVVRYWYRHDDADVLCSLAFIDQYYIMPDNRVLLGLVPYDDERAGHRYPAVYYRYLDELQIDLEACDQLEDYDEDEVQEKQ